MAKIWCSQCHSSLVIVCRIVGGQLVPSVFRSVAPLAGWLSLWIVLQLVGSSIAADLAHEELERFVGRYQISFSRPSEWTLNIVRDGDRLSAQILNYSDKLHLYPKSSDTCITIEDAMTLRFVKGESGRFTDIVSDAGWRATRKLD